MNAAPQANNYFASPRSRPPIGENVTAAREHYDSMNTLHDGYNTHNGINGPQPPFPQENYGGSSLGGYPHDNDENLHMGDARMNGRGLNFNGFSPTHPTHAPPGTATATGPMHQNATNNMQPMHTYQNHKSTSSDSPVQELDVDGLNHFFNWDNS